MYQGLSIRRLPFDRSCMFIPVGHSVTEERTLKFLPRSSPSSIEVVAMSSLAIFTKQSAGTHGNFSPVCRCRQYLLSLLPFQRLVGHVWHPFEPQHHGRCECSAPILGYPCTFRSLALRVRVGRSLLAPHRSASNLRSRESIHVQADP